MANNSKDVELRIRARDYSQKTLSDVVDSLKELIKAQEAQQEAAKRGEVSASELEASYRRLENAAKALLGQNALIESFRAQSQALEEAQARTQAARQAQEEYARSLAGTEAPTKRQIAELGKLERAVAGAEKAEQRAADRLAVTVQKLDSYGIAAADVVSAQSRIAAGVREANAALERQDDAIANVDKHLRAAKAAAEAKAAADRENARAAAEAMAAAERRAAAEAKAAKIAADEAKAQQEMRHALNKAADEALAAAKGYDTLAHSIETLGASSLARTLRGIANPAAEAIKSLEGVEKAVGEFEKRVASINGPIKDYRETLNSLNAVQKSLTEMGGLIDAYRRQEHAVQRAREEYQAARQAVQDLAQQMRAGNGPVSEMSRQMTQAQARLRAAATEMRNQQQAAQHLKETLHQAGVSTRNLAEAESRMVEAATRAKTSTDNLTAAYKKYGAEVESAHRKTISKWTDGGRTTLSWAQRIRGELLALATAYVGVQAAVDLAKSALDAYRSTQTIESRLSILVGNDAEAIKGEWDYLMGQANRLGFGFEQLALDYAKFGIAAKSAGMDLQETRFIFERMAEAARGARLSTDDFGGVMNAVEQMLSKGTISAEELRQQLGDRLPGAFAAAARGAGMTLEEFTKALELGNISSEYVINLAREAGDNYKTAFEMAANSMVAAEGRLQTATFEFRKAIADGGFVTAYTQFIEELTELLKSEDGQQLAQSLSEAFSGLVDVLRWCAENTELVKAAFAIFLGMNVAAVLNRWAPAVLNLAGGLRSVYGALTALKGGLPGLLTTVAGVGTAAGAGAAGVTKMTGAVRLLGIAAKTALRFVPFLGAAITAWEVYDLIAGKKDDAQKAGEDLGKAVADGMVATLDPGTGGTEAERVRKAILKTLEREDERTAKMDTEVRKKDHKDNLAERLKIAAEPFEEMKKQARAYITDKEKLNETLEAIEKSSLARQAVEREKFRVEQERADRGAAERRRRLALEVAMELDKIEADLAKRRAMQDPNNTYAEREAARLADVAHSYDALRRKIEQMAQFDKARAKLATERLDAYVAERQEIERITVKQEELKRLQDQLNQQVSLRSSLLAAVQAEYDAGLMSTMEYRDRVAEVNEMMGDGIADAGQRLREFAEAMRDLMDPAAYQELMARVNATVTANQGAATNLLTDRNNAEMDLNRMLAERTRINDRIQQQFELGLISDRERARQITENNEAYKQQIMDQADAVIRYAEAMRNPANAEAMDALIAKMQALKLETENATVAYTEMDSVMVNSIVNNGVTAFEQMSAAIGDLILGQKSVSEMFKEMGRASLQFFAQFMRDIALAIIKQQILNALRASGNPYMAAAATAMGATQNHSGGIVGLSGNHTRRVDPSWFAGAPRFHSGGLPGLQPDEVPSILQKGEEVLSRDDPRNILNGGGASGGPSAYRFVLVDDRAKVAEAMTTPEGEEAVLVNIRRNAPTIKQMLGG